MTQIIAWKCDYTSKVFTDKAMYVGHLRMLAKQLRYERNMAVRLAQVEAKIAALQSEQFSIDMLASKLLENEQLIWDSIVFNDLAQSYRRDMVKRVKDPTWRPKLVSVKFSKMRYEHIDTYSEAPRGQQPACVNPQIDSRGNRITQYAPGWCGRVELEVQTHPRMQGWYLSSDWMKAVNIYTGAGGGGGSPKADHQRYSYSVKLFADDWSGMKMWREKEEVVNILKGDI